MIKGELGISGRQQQLVNSRKKDLYIVELARWAPRTFDYVAKRFLHIRISKVICLCFDFVLTKFYDG